MAARYRDTALRFACLETIEWIGREEGTGTRQYGYVYSHNDSEGFHDYRTHANAIVIDGRVIRIDPNEDEVPTYLANPLLWTFVFKQSRQPYHRYRLVGEDTIFGQPAVKVQFEPIPPFKKNVNDWLGTAWIDRNTSMILRVEAFEPRDQESKASIERYLSAGVKRPRFVPIQSVVTEYTVTMNGIRLPGRTEIQVSQVRIKGRRNPSAREDRVLTVVQTYDGYEFFTVRTLETVD